MRYFNQMNCVGCHGAPGVSAEPGTGADPVDLSEPGAYLLDPSPAVTRAGLVEDLARLLGARKIDPRIAFLTADREVATPFARTLRVVRRTSRSSSASARPGVWK